MLKRINRLFALNAGAQTTLSFSWSNFDGSQTIYLSDDYSVNDITITMANNTEGTITFPPGMPYPINERNDYTAGVLYIMFAGQYIPAPAVQNMICVAKNELEQWASIIIWDEEYGMYLAISSFNGASVGPGQSVVFKLKDVMSSPVTQPEEGGTVKFTYVNIDGLEDDRVSLQVPLSERPTPVNRNLNPLVGFAGTDMVFVGTEPNDLTLYITNSRPDPIDLSSVPARPVFSISFAYGDGTGALTTLVNSGSISVNMAGGNDNKWDVIAKTLGENPYWQFKPTTKTVLGTGALATAQINIGNIITELPPGITYAMVTWTEIEGYNPGQVPVSIVKADPIIIALSADPEKIEDRIDPGTVKLSFEVKNATFVTITNTVYAKQTNTDELRDNVDVTIETTTTFTLIATNIYTGQQLSESVTVPVKLNTYNLLPLGTVLMWAGGINEIPWGWTLCDGKELYKQHWPPPAGWTQGNGVDPKPGYWTVPDLRDKFVTGAKRTNVDPFDNVNYSGPADQHIHPFTVSKEFDTSLKGRHKHGIYFKTTTCLSSGDTSHHKLYHADKGYESGCHNQDNTHYTHEEPDHWHEVTVSFDKAPTAAQTGEIRPPWYALAFIIKVF